MHPNEKPISLRKRLSHAVFICALMLPGHAEAGLTITCREWMASTALLASAIVGGLAIQSANEKRELAHMDRQLVEAGAGVVTAPFGLLGESAEAELQELLVEAFAEDPDFTNEIVAGVVSGAIGLASAIVLIRGRQKK